MNAKHGKAPDLFLKKNYVYYRLVEVISSMNTMIGTRMMDFALGRLNRAIRKNKWLILSQL